jgi:hypothetical protein
MPTGSKWLPLVTSRLDSFSSDTITATKEHAMTTIDRIDHTPADRAHSDAYKALTRMADEYDALAKRLYDVGEFRPSDACARLAVAAREARHFIGAI